MIYPRKIDLNTGWTTNRNFLLLEKIIHIFHPVVRYLDRLSVRNASFLLANGRYIGDIIEQIYAKEYTDCPAGSDPFDKTEIIDNSNEIYSGKLRINGFEVKKPYILLTNRHYPQKKFEYALEALTIVKRVIPSVTLAISGAFTSYTEKLRQLAEKLKVSKEVVFLGEVDDKLMAEIYRNAAVYVYTSPEEDYGMGVVEAENAGVPVVAWNHAGPTVTIRDRETGFLAKPYQVDDFSDKVMKLLKDKNLRMNMGKKAHENVQRYFTWEAHLDILERATLVSLKSNGRKKRRRRKN
jgi:glycosyltransferase involved in cell wall biosynthesis